MSTFYGDMYGEKKKGAAMRFAGLAGVAAVLGAGCFAAYQFSDTVKNQVKLAFAKPQDYLAWVCEKNTNDLAEIIGGCYQQGLNDRENGAGISAALRFEPNPEGIDSLLGDYAADIKRSGPEKELFDILRNAESIGLTADAAVQYDHTSERFKLRFNDKEIVSAECVFDLNDSVAYMRVPELKEKWLGLDCGALAEQYLGSEKIIPKNDALPTGAEIAETVRKYGTMFPAHLSNVSVARSESVRISEIETNYIAISAEMSKEQLLDTVQDMIAAAQNDSVLESLTRHAFDYGDIMAYIGQKFNQLCGKLSGNEQMIELKLYVDAAGTIRGVDIADGDGIGVFAAAGMDGDRLGAEWMVTNNGNPLCSVFADAYRSGETFSGQASVCGRGNLEEAVISFVNLRTVGDRQRYLSGDVTVCTKLDNFAATLQFSSDGNGQTINYPVVYDGRTIGTLNMTAAPSEIVAMEIPDRSESYMIQNNMQAFFLKDYLDADSFSRFCTDTMKKIGLSDQNAEKAAELLD